LAEERGSGEKLASGSVHYSDEMAKGLIIVEDQGKEGMFGGEWGR
jgi:hypothetical protein